jgi:hypothetical protein
MAHTKFIFDRWYTGHKRCLVSAIQAPMLNICPCCREPGETTIHILRCAKNSDREETLQELRKQLSPDEYHPVFSLLRKGIMAWFEGTNYVPDITGYPSKMRVQILTALNDQEKMGWNNAIKGYLSVEWRTLAETSLHDSMPMQVGTGMNLMKSILVSFHQATQRLWKAHFPASLFVPTS